MVSNPCVLLNNIEYFSNTVYTTFYQSVSDRDHFFINISYFKGKIIACDNLILRKNGEKRQRL